MKSNTLVNPETQVNLETPVRIQQLKLGVDWHADQFRVVRMCDGQSPQLAQPQIIRDDRSVHANS